MKYQDIHPWTVRELFQSYSEALLIQKKLSRMVESKPLDQPVNFVAGADISFSKADNRLFTAVVVLTFPDLLKVEEVRAEAEAAFPYVPGLLSFREAPPLLAAFAQLQHDPDAILIDGQGIAHPRRLGLASHLANPMKPAYRLSFSYTHSLFLNFPPIPNHFPLTNISSRYRTG